MMGRGVVIVAVLGYAAVMLGCVLGGRVETTTSADAPGLLAADLGGGGVSVNNPRAGVRAPRLPMRGVAMQLQRIDWVEEYKKSIDEIAALGADTVMLSVDARMENGSSSRIYLDVRFTPTPQQLTEVIRHAKDKHQLRVVLMPIVLLDNPRGMEWRGTLNPDDWSDWWRSYRAMLHHYSWIAEGSKVDVLVVGSELVSTESKVQEWRETIAEVRKTFKGMLTYSANWDHYEGIPFWDELDLIAMNSYYTLGENHRVTVEQVVKNWQPFRNKILNFVRRKGKPLLFTEVGWHSLQNTASAPWDYTLEHLPIDLDLQRRLYEGYFRVWHGTPEMGGFMIWEWPPGPGGPDNKGYTPEGKPAEKVLKEWFAKPKWDVK